MSRHKNVIYDFDRTYATRIIHEHLDEVRVGCCGRYCDWSHAWTDDALATGERAARAALE